MVRFVASLVLIGVLVVALGPAVQSEPPQEPKAAAEEKKPPVRLDRYGDPLPPGAIMRLGTLRLRHQGAVTSVAFSSDSKMIASAGADKTVRLWDAATGKELRRFEQHAKSVVFSPDGKLVAAGGASSPIRVWNTESGKETVAITSAHSFAVFALSAAGPTLIAAGSDQQRKGVISFWKMGSGEEIRELKTEKPVLCLGVSPDGKTVAINTDDGIEKVRVSEADSGKELPKPAIYQSPTCLHFSSDGKTLACGRNAALSLSDVATGKTLLSLANGAEAVAFSPDGKLLAWAGQGGIITVRDLPTGTTLRLFETQASAINSLTFSHDSTTLVSGGSDRLIRCWDIPAGKETCLFEGHRGSAVGVAFHPKGKILATGGGGQVILWDLTTGKTTHTLQPPESRNPLEAFSGNSVTFSPDGQFLAAAGGDRLVHLWEVATGTYLASLRGHERGYVTSVLFSPGGMLASAADDGTIRFWDAAKGKELRKLKGGGTQADRDMPTCLAFSTDGKLLAVGTTKWRHVAIEGHAVQIWEVSTGKMIANLGGHKTAINCVAFSLDGKRVGSASADNLVRIWVMETGAQRPPLRGHDRGVSAIVFLNGNTLLSGGYDRVIRVWDLATGIVSRDLRGHEWTVSSLALAPDGKVLASASSDGLVLIWDLTASAK